MATASATAVSQDSGRSQENPRTGVTRVPSAGLPSSPRTCGLIGSWPMLWKKSAGWGCIQEWGWGVTCASPTENSWRCSAKRTAWSCARRAAGPPSIRPTMWCPWRMSPGIIRWEMEASPRPQSSFSPAPHLAISRSRTWDGAPETRWELIRLLTPPGPGCLIQWAARLLAFMTFLPSLPLPNLLPPLSWSHRR